VIGSRLTIARTFHGLAQADLGQRVGSCAEVVARMEAGLERPDPHLVGRLARALGFGPAFFATTLSDTPRDDECHGLLDEEPRLRALAHVSLLAELVAWLDNRVRLPAASLPPLSGADPESAAAACRRLWGLAPDLPIPSLTRVIERAGVVVAQSEGEGLARVGPRLLVVVGRCATRLSLARLAGHLVLHRGARPGPGLADEADRFAAALLLPREGLLRDLPRAPSLSHTSLAPLAAWWRVDLDTLVRRAACLPIANAARYRDLAEHRYGLQRIPGSVDTTDEVPEVIDLALGRLAEGPGIRRREVARRLSWSPEVFAAVTGHGGADKVVSLAAWRARRGGARTTGPLAPPLLHDGGLARLAALPPPMPPRGVQLELDFGPRGAPPVDQWK
jgi:transcriptional regulator with XRE-family HTH domain